MRLITAAEQKAIDRIWQDRTGLPLLLLMEAAAGAVAGQCRCLAQDVGKPSLPVLVLAGRGQNGGDAFACARLLLASGWAVACRELEPSADLPPEAAANRQALRNLGCTLGPAKAEDFTAVAGGIIVDGLFGTGYRAGRQQIPEFVRLSAESEAARQKGAQIVSIDLPSGLDADDGRTDASCITADLTVTFVRSKPGLHLPGGRSHAGRIVVDAIGVGDDLVSEALSRNAPIMLLDHDEVCRWAPPRPADSHKGLFGRTMLIGGSAGMPGAILLAAEAAARSGTGLLSLYVPQSIAPMILGARPEALLTAIRDDQPKIDELLAAAQISQAVGIGPGIGQPVWLGELMAGLIDRTPRLVIDADGLNHLAHDPSCYWPLLRNRHVENGLLPAILTPHPGEFRRLAPDLDPQDRLRSARLLADRSGCMIILKGQSTVVAEPGGSCWINSTGNDGLARGGSGDVLCGLVTGLLAQGMDPFRAAAAGVYLHGLSADLAAAGTGRRTLVPRDVIAGMGHAFRQAGWEAGSVTT